jgi:mono/diheme cytochrome c family protein
MKLSCLVLSCATLIGLSGAAFAQDKSPGSHKAGGGEDIFKANCVLCHGSDGHSQTALGKQLGALDLHSAEVQKKTDAELKTVITDGLKSMPPFAAQLSSEQIGQVLGYVRGLGKKKK